MPTMFGFLNVPTVHSDEEANNGVQEGGSSRRGKQNDEESYESQDDTNNDESYTAEGDANIFDGSEPKDLWTVNNLNIVPPSLQNWNLIATALYITQALAMGFNFALLDDHVQWPVYTTYPVNGEGTETWKYGDYGPPVAAQWIRLSLTLFSMLIMLSSSLSHGMVVVPGGRMLYSWYIQRNQNPRRWFEYVFSFGLVKVMIGLVVGISDIHILVGLFVLNGSSMLLLSTHEKVNAKARNDGFYLLWFPYICSIIPQLANWFITASYFGSSLMRLDSVSIYIWEIFILMFVFDLVLYLIMFYQWAKVGDFDYYVFGEVALIVQGIMAKSFLAWITFGSGLR